MTKVDRQFNGWLWLILGLFIFLWILWPSERLGDIIWFGFGIGCTLTGIHMIQDNRLIVKRSQ